MDLNNMNLPEKAYVDQGPYGGHRHCAPQEDLERLADDMTLLAEAIRKGIALDGFGTMRKLTEKILHELGEHTRGRDYTSLSGEHSHSLPQDHSEEDERPCGCRCPLEGDTFYNELCEQLKVKLDERILETIKTSRGLQERQIPLVHSHSIPNYSDEEIAEMRRMYACAPGSLCAHAVTDAFEKSGITANDIPETVYVDTCSNATPTCLSEQK